MAASDWTLILDYITGLWNERLSVNQIHETLIKKFGYMKRSTITKVIKEASNDN